MKRSAVLIAALLLLLSSAAHAQTLSLEAGGEEEASAFAERADAGEYVLSAGSFTPAVLPAGGAAAFFSAEADPAALFLQRMAAAWKEHSSETVDISDLGFSVEEGICLYGAAMNANPRCFDVSTVFRYYHAGGIMTGIIPAYTHTKAESEQRLAEYEAALEKMVNASVSEADFAAMTDAEIALAVHDHLALRVRYSYKAVQNLENDPDAGNVYGAIVNGSAVCQGYSLAYGELLAANGIASAIVTSDRANHAWNLVVLNDGIFHVDITFNDPGFPNSPDGDSDMSGRVRHTFFLLTDAELLAADTVNDRSDMVSAIGAAERADAAHPDSALWKNALTMFYCGSGKWLRHNAYAGMSSAIANMLPVSTGAELCSLEDTAGETLFVHNAYPLYGFLTRAGEKFYCSVFRAGAAGGEICLLDPLTMKEETVLVLQEGHIAEELEEADGEIWYLDLWYDSAAGKVLYERKKLEAGGEAETPVPGDLTGDGKADRMDAIALAKHIAGLCSFSADALTAAGFVPAEVSVGDVIGILGAGA